MNASWEGKKEENLGKDSVHNITGRHYQEKDLKMSLFLVM